MKKVILSLVAMAFSGAMMAQNGTLAGNVPTVGSDGFTFDFLMTGTENCLAGGGVAYDAATSQAWSIDGSGHLVVSIPHSNIYESNTQTLKFYTGNCISSTIDLSTAADQKIEVSLNASKAGQLLVVMYTGANSNYNATPATMNFVAGQQTVSSALNLTGSGMNSAALTKIGLLFRGPIGWGDTTLYSPAAASITVDYVKIGTVATLTGTTAALDNSLISVYPNPAKEQINIDLSSMNNAADATVKIMNSNGMLVYEANASNSNEIINTSSFNKGIYLVQVSSGNKVSNKKVVIE